MNDGGDISPRYRQRFTADIAHHDDLLRLVDKVEPFSVIAVLTPAGKSSRVYGIGSSTLEKGNWSTKLGKRLETSFGCHSALICNRPRTVSVIAGGTIGAKGALNVVLVENANDFITIGPVELSFERVCRIVVILSTYGNLHQRIHRLNC